MKKLTLISFSIYFLNANAQITFHKTFTGLSTLYAVAGAALQTNGKGYIVGGVVNGKPCLFKTNEFGDTIWTRLYDGLYSAKSVQKTFDGGYLLFGDDGYTGNVFLLKSDSLGTLIWGKRYGGVGSSHWEIINGSSNNLQSTWDGGNIFVCSTNRYGAGGFDFYVVKTNALGDITWTKTYGVAGDDLGFSLVQTPDSGYLICGQSGNSAGGIYLVKTKSNGDTLWTKRIYSGQAIFIGKSIAPTSDGGYIIAGNTASGVGGEDMCLVKITKDGNPVWNKSYGGGSSDWGYSAHQTFDGGYILSGYAESSGISRDMYLVKTNSIGDTLWTRVYGEDTHYDEATYIQQTNDSGFIVAGLTCAGDCYLNLIKLNKQGNVNIDPACYSVSPFSPHVVSYTTYAVNTSSIVSSGGAAYTTGPNITSGCWAAPLCPTIGIKEYYSPEGISLSPNPFHASGTLKVYSGFQNAELVIYNIYGEEVRRVKITSQSHIIYRNGLVDGIYFYRVMNREGNIASGKFVVN